MTTIVITGANTGIGRATAEGLAGPGVRLLLAGRSLERTQPVIEAVRARGGDAEFVALDLTDLRDIRRAAGDLSQKAPKLDVLINNAGVAGVHGQTRDGFELHVGVNHLGHFALVQALMPVLTSSKTRVVAVASEAHRRARGLDFGAFEHTTKSRTGWSEYCASKLCNVLFATELSRRHSSQGIFGVSLHPGVIASDLWRHVPLPIRALLKMFMRSNEDGARTSIHCATAPLEMSANGAYFDKCKVRWPTRVAQDEALAAELWERSLALVNR